MRSSLKEFVSRYSSESDKYVSQSEENSELSSVLNVSSWFKDIFPLSLKEQAVLHSEIDLAEDEQCCKGS